jgi:uncharacterized protein YkwD
MDKLCYTYFVNPPPDPCLITSAGFMLFNQLYPILSHLIYLWPQKHTKWLTTTSSLFLVVGLSLFNPIAAYASPINASDLILQTNIERKTLGLSELDPNHKLTQAAHKKALDILNKQYFAHTTPDGKPFYEWIEENNYNYLYAGENLAIDFSTNEGVIKAWMESPLHKANILNSNYNEIGLVSLWGEYEGKETNVVVQMFGSLLTDSPTVLGLTLEKLSNDFRLRKNSIETLAQDLIMLPSMAGSSYFDIIVRPKEDTQIAVSNTWLKNIASSPTTKIAQNDTYQTLLKYDNKCCENDTTFALTEESKGATISTPITFPKLKSIIENIAIKKTGMPILPQNIYLNLLIAGLISILLLMAYETEIKKEFELIKKKI